MVKLKAPRRIVAIVLHGILNTSILNPSTYKVQIPLGHNCTSCIINSNVFFNMGILEILKA
ncbi:MAG TPA: hypothetical protein VE594_01275 [Nitrososphaeraceae archaeon]|nr:hypothetical protein [Nitrososphaeraceae archaeon]